VPLRQFVPAFSVKVKYNQKALNFNDRTDFLCRIFDPTTFLDFQNIPHYPDQAILQGGLIKELCQIDR
jgi:hypothetical protein